VFRSLLPYIYIRGILVTFAFCICKVSNTNGEVVVTFGTHSSETAGSPLLREGRIIVIVSRGSTVVGVGPDNNRLGAGQFAWDL